jgi:hypothetical protein
MEDTMIERSPVTFHSISRSDWEKEVRTGKSGEEECSGK